MHGFIVLHDLNDLHEMHDVHALHDTPKAVIMQTMHTLKTMQTMHFMHPGRGVLAYDRDRAVFVAFELDAGCVTAQQQRDIAASVAFAA
mgnify:FL=1